MIAKVFLVLVAAVGVASIWLDPFTYTLHPAGPDPSPAWWRVVSVLDSAVLVAFAWSVLKTDWRRAYILIALSTTLSLVMNSAYVRLRGVDRFLVIFRTEEILSLYLLLTALRVLALFACGVAAMNRVDRRPVSGA